MLLKSFRVYCINCVRDAEAVGCGGPVDHSGLEEPRSTDRAGRRDRVPSPRLEKRVSKDARFFCREKDRIPGLKSRTQGIYRKTWEQRSWGAVVRWTTLGLKSPEAPTEPGGETESRRLDKKTAYLEVFLYLFLKGI